MTSNTRSFFLFILISLSFSVHSESILPTDYDEVEQNIFWNKLYGAGGWTLYCGLKFDATRRGKRGEALRIEHIYPSEWMLKYSKCHSRQECREQKNEKFLRMEADLHNMYPVWEAADVARRDSQFAELAGEFSRFDKCDFERRGGKVEPRNIAKGNIARTIFYMHKEYAMPIPDNMLIMLEKWHEQDPPSEQELARNDMIEQLQGTRNTFIDNPDSAKSLILRAAKR